MKEAAKIMKAGFDLANLDVVASANEGVEVELEHPATPGVGLGIHVTVIGRDSDEFQRLSTAQARRRLARLSKPGARRQQQDTEELLAENIELLASCVKGWRGMVQGGSEVAFSHEAAVSLLTRYPWMREQIDAAVANRALFIKA